MQGYEDGPPGDDYYSGAHGKNMAEHTAASHCFHHDGPQRPAIT